MATIFLCKFSPRMFFLQSYLKHEKKSYKKIVLQISHLGGSLSQKKSYLKMICRKTSKKYAWW